MGTANPALWEYRIWPEPGEAIAQRLQVGGVCEQEFAAPEGMIEPAAVQPMDVHAEAELADKDFSEQGGPRLERRAVSY